MLIKLFYIGMPVVRTEGRFAWSLGRAVNGHVITNLALRLRSSNDMTSLSIAIT